MEKEYWIELTEEYDVYPGGELMHEKVTKYYDKNKEQTDYLLNRYGESAWNIHRFMELCRAEEISESFFRQLVRYEMDKCFKRIEDNEEI